MSIKPDWQEIALRIEKDLSLEEINSAWILECNNWLDSISENFGGCYRRIESKNFSILSSEEDRYLQVFSAFLERTLKRILETLKGIASDEGYGKHVAIIFKNIDHYYEYICMFYPEEGEYGLTSGMFINEGYGHFVFPSQDIDVAEPLAVHELTHACLTHLPIPTWVNEGLAVSMEEVLAGNALYIDKDIFAQHEKYWNEETIQKFWSGESFHSMDEGQGLSYQLAHILIRNISKDFDAFAKFVNDAHFGDAGEKAAKDHFGTPLSYMVGCFLGNGNWAPNKGV